MLSKLVMSGMPLCQGVKDEIFFPNNPTKEIVSMARVLCLMCPLAKECLIAELDMEPEEPTYKFGIRAGTTPKDRVELQKLYKSGGDWETRWRELLKESPRWRKPKQVKVVEVKVGVDLSEWDF